MIAIAALGLTAFLLCLVLTPVCRNLSRRYGLVDHPDSDRKLQKEAIPRTGGVPIVLSYAGAVVVLYFLAPHGARIYIQHQKLLLSLLPAAGIMFLTGLIDDIVELKPWQKLSGQVIAAGLAVSLGARIEILHGFSATPWITIPFSLVWLIGCANAVNLIDGLDGLASGVGLFATLTTLAAAVVTGNNGLVVATVPLAACLLAFLRYNFSPASIYLGDCGSLTIGFMLGCFGLIWSHHGGSLFAMTLPVMALSLPLIDVALAIGRRAMRSVPIFKGDRGHIHHMVLARGHTPHAAALILYGFCALAAVFAFLQSFSGFFFHAPIFVLFGCVIWIGIDYLGYIELRAARKIFSRKSLLGMVQDEIYLQELDNSLAEARTLEDFWEVVRTCCGEMQFANVRMYLQGRSFEEEFDKVVEPAWTLVVALGDKGHLMLARSADVRPPRLAMSVLEYLQTAATMREMLDASRTYSGAA